MAAGTLALIISLIGFFWRIDLCPRPVTVWEYILAVREKPLGVTFLGASTLLIDDGGEAILIDGFFSRPALNPLTNFAISIDEAAIDAALASAKISVSGTTRALTLRAVVVNHSHYDHAMDAPIVAKKTGAAIVGSKSTSNLARAHQVPEQQIVADFDPSAPKGYCFGGFRVVAVRTGHVGGDEISEIPVNTIPSTVGGYLEGGTYALFVHGPASPKMLVQGSAGFRTGALHGYRADAAYLAVGALSPSNTTYNNIYWNETAGNVAPRRVFPIHWDRLSGALSNEPVPLLGTASLMVVGNKARAANLECVKPRVGVRINPFAAAGTPLGEACP